MAKYMYDTFALTAAIAVVSVALVADLVEGFSGFPAPGHLLGLHGNRRIQCGNDRIRGGTAHYRKGSRCAMFASTGAGSDFDQTKFIVKALQSSNGVFDRLSSDEIEALGSAFEPITMPVERNRMMQKQRNSMLHWNEPRT